MPASVLGLAGGAGRDALSQSVLVSLGADAANLRTDDAVIVVHLVICAASLGVPAWFLIAAYGGAPRIRTAAA
ncbi:hypothetical protein [Arthrobacter sp. C152]